MHFLLFFFLFQYSKTFNIVADFRFKSDNRIFCLYWDVSISTIALVARAVFCLENRFCASFLLLTNTFLFYISFHLCITCRVHGKDKFLDGIGVYCFAFFSSSKFVCLFLHSDWIFVIYLTCYWQFNDKSRICLCSTTTCFRIFSLPFAFMFDSYLCEVLYTSRE